jgi:hypothetical protein
LSAARPAPRPATSAGSTCAAQVDQGGSHRIGIRRPRRRGSSLITLGRGRSCPSTGPEALSAEAPRLQFCTTQLRVAGARVAKATRDHGRTSSPNATENGSSFSAVSNAPCTSPPVSARQLAGAFRLPRESLSLPGFLTRGVLRDTQVTHKVTQKIKEKIQ